jgi:hypothetical protein
LVRIGCEEGYLFETKLDAEIYARKLFPDENGLQRYARIYSKLFMNLRRISAMTRTELGELLNRLELEKGLRFDYGESFEGAQYIRFDVDDDDGDKLLSEATDEEIIAFADDEGYTLTVKDCQAIRERGRDGETIREAVNALIEEENEDETENN